MMEKTAGKICSAAMFIVMTVLYILYLEFLAITWELKDLFRGNGFDISVFYRIVVFACKFAVFAYKANRDYIDDVITYREYTDSISNYFELKGIDL